MLGAGRNGGLWLFTHQPSQLYPQRHRHRTHSHSNQTVVLLSAIYRPPEFLIRHCYGALLYSIWFQELTKRSLLIPLTSQI